MGESGAGRVLALAASLMLVVLPVRAGDPAHPRGVAPLPHVSSVRLYVLDCGTLIYNRPEDYNLTREEVADTNMIVTCYLVMHPKGLLLFDTGLADRLVGRPVYENVLYGYAQVKFNTLVGQLADIGVKPADIQFLAISHSDFDHVGNVDEFTHATWLAQQAEMPGMFGPGAPPEVAEACAPLAGANKVMLSGDHDVFGDGSVVLKFTPGHTPGHQSLFVRLAHTGNVVLSGDLYHYPEERTLQRMPDSEKPTAGPASRAAMESFLVENHAQLWIGHSTAWFRDAVKAPRWYE
jgi:N-acyl homoserine lactone hydrolase